jgi:5,10-methylenetetrahydrofolate reductase
MKHGGSLLAFQKLIGQGGVASIIAVSEVDERTNQTNPCVERFSICEISTFTMGFLRVVEVFPPRFPDIGRKDPIDLRKEIGSFVREVRSVKAYSDLFLVADLKKLGYLKLSTAKAASLLQEAGLDAAPTIVARDRNKPEMLSSILTAIATGVSGIFLVWGDRYPAEAGVTNVRDFDSLSEVISAAYDVTERAGKKLRIFAPVDLEHLRTSRGVHLAEARLKAGASLLLAQPPTGEAEEIFDNHLDILEAVGLKDKVLMNVFPFRSNEDVERMEELFGWRLPWVLHRKAAKGGEKALIDEARHVVSRARRKSLPGIYVATRGSPQLARKILG